MAYKIGLLLCALVVAKCHAKEYRLGLDIIEAEEVDKVYERSRALLSADEKAFLEDILAADEVLIERQKRGIVDQILSAISGSSGLLNIVGSSNNNRLVGTSAPATAAPVTAAAIAATTAPAAAATNPNANNPDNHLFNQISKVVTSSGSRNVTGIVDAALMIGTPAPVRDLVNGIVGIAYCNGIRRLLGRC